MANGGDWLSILDSIQAAEAKAEQAKIDAANKVEALMEQTKKNAEIKGNDLLKEAQVVAQKIAKETAIKLAANEKELIANLFKSLELLKDDYLGGSGSRGYGQISIDIEKIQEKKSDKYYGISDAEPNEITKKYNNQIEKLKS